MNTYVLIARNTTYIHEILSAEFKSRFPNQDVLLATCGVIDARKYVMSGSLAVHHIATAALTSEFGSCHLDFMNVGMSVNPTRELLIHDTPRILYFAMQLEALIFHVDTNVPPQHILSAIKSKRCLIEKEIRKTQHKYKARGAPPWLNAETYAFMNEQAFAGLRDELGIIPSTPGEQLDDLFQELIQHKYWKKINPDIIKSIFNNAKGDVDAVKRFISISELHNSVANNFVKLANEEPREIAMWSFAITLYRLGSELLKHGSSAETHEEVKFFGVQAEAAFMSSILCDSFCLESYFGIACLFAPINKDVSLEWCAKYKEAEDKLLNTPNEELNTGQLAEKNNLVPEPEEFRNILSLIAEKAPHFLPDGWEENEGKSLRDKINEIEAELLEA